MSQSGSRTNVKSDCFYTVEVEFNDIEVYIPPTKHRKFLFGPPRSTMASVLTAFERLLRTLAFFGALAWKNPQFYWGWEKYFSTSRRK